VSATFKSPMRSGYEGAIQMSIDNALFTNLVKLALNKEASAPTRAIATLKLEQLKSWLQSKPTSDEEWKAFNAYLVKQIDQFQDAPDEYKEEKVLDAPPGMPIGMMDGFCEND